MVKRLGHDDYINLLIGCLLPYYDRIEEKIEYEKGEIDIRGFKGNKFDIYEVKCGSQKDKAIRQLQRAQKYFKKECRKTFYYCGQLNKLEEI